MYGIPAISMLPTLLRPKSRGSITLQSNDPDDQPIIDPNFLAEVEDVDFFVRGSIVKLKCEDI